TSARQAVQGDFLEMHRIGGEGKGLVISENLAQLQALKLGQTLDIPTPSGWLRLPVAGVLRDYSGQQGTVFLDSSVYLRYWKSDAIDIFRVYLQPGARSADVKQRILERFSGQRRLFVLLNKEVKDFIFQITDQWFGMTYVQIFIAVLVAVLGIVNTLTVSIADRRRELGVLRAVGGLASQIRHTIWLEAAMIAAVGLILGLSLGAVNLYYQLEMSRRDFSGMTLDYRFPWTIAAALLPVIAGAALAASIGPAEAAVRGSLVEALEYE
ncbi:MAG: FtsX-like permease family protein, partial [Acidobacteria bacterium]|nr:FtsX-like permease family protein [Acidobacteriota bacterium]